jgi:hypothetical protein
MKDDRWRGNIPLRLGKRETPGTKTFTSKRRGGEPSPAPNPWMPEGHGMREGSYTMSIAEALWTWQKQKLGIREGENVFPAIVMQLVFKYRLHRRKIITVVGHSPYIYHNHKLGGVKGFFMKLHIDSIDGKRLGKFPLQNLQGFALNRIIAESGGLVNLLPSPS